MPAQQPEQLSAKSDAQSNSTGIDLNDMYLPGYEDQFSLTDERPYKCGGCGNASISETCHYCVSMAAFKERKPFVRMQPTDPNFAVPAFQQSQKLAEELYNCPVFASFVLKRNDSSRLE